MKSKQGGASFLSWILIAAMVSVIGLIAARLAPAYIDYSDDHHADRSVAGRQSASDGKGEIYDALQETISDQQHSRPRRRRKSCGSTGNATARRWY